MPKQNLQCPFCPKTSSHGAGLASHIRSSHPREHTGWLASHRSGQAPAAHASTADGFEGIIASLEQQKSAIERALEALRVIEGPVQEAAVARPQPRAAAPSKRHGGITAAGRRRLAEAMKRRWAAKRTAAQAKKSARKKAA